MIVLCESRISHVTVHARGAVVTRRVTVPHVPAGEIELAFAILPLPDGPFEAHQLLSDPYVLVVRDSSPLAAKRTLTLQELADQPLVCLKDCRSADQALALLEATSGVPPEVVFRAAETGTVEGMVEAGAGVALMPSLGFGGRPSLVALPLGELLPPRVTALVRHRDRDLGDPADEFVAAAVRSSRRVALAAERDVRAA